MSGGAGTIAKIGIPLAAAALSGGVLAPALAPELVGVAGLDAAGAATAAGALTGAATGAAGSALTGGNPLTGAALGGIGGGIMPNLPASLGGIDTAAANGVNPGIGQGFNAAGDSVAVNSPEATSFGVSAPAVLASNAAQGVSPAASGGIGGLLSRNALPIAGGLAVLATSNNGKPGPAPVGDNRQANNVQPLQRTQIATNPNAYYGIGGARQNFDVVNPQVNPQIKYYADGGSVQDKSDMQKNRDDAMQSLARLKSTGYPAAAIHPGMNEQAEYIHNRYLNDGSYPGTLAQYVADNYDVNAPTPRAIIENYKSGGSVGHYAFGGAALYQKAKGPSYFKQGQSSPLRKPVGLAMGGHPDMPQIPQANVPHPQMPQGIGSMVQGAGDGQSDSIPAQLSDGEFVVSAPVVSALGRGSNTAGAKKLHNMQKNVMAKTYRGAKPPAAGMGIGAMRAA